ncbi:MAG: methyltransferase domain-containing protein [Alphaproteobacteria bacterium]
MIQNDDNPLVFDRKLLRTRRHRAALQGADAGADYLIAQAADLLADRLLDLTHRFDHGIELGSHKGVLAQRLLQTGRVGSFTHTDICAAMLPDHGSRIVLDEEFLPLAPASQDLIASALSLHWVNDLPGALLQIRQALKPDGLFLATLFGAETLKELRHCLMLAEDEISGGVSPRVSPFADLSDMAGLMQRAGFALPVADVDRVTVTYAHPLKLMQDLRMMGETGLSRGRTKSFTPRRVLLRASELYLQQFAETDPETGTARIFATFDMIHVSGWAHAKTQQQPLQPGTASQRLADALNTTEQDAGDAAAPGRYNKNKTDK